MATWTRRLFHSARHNRLAAAVTLHWAALHNHRWTRRSSHSRHYCCCSLHCRWCRPHWLPPASSPDRATWWARCRGVMCVVCAAVASSLLHVQVQVHVHGARVRVASGARVHCDCGGVRGSSLRQGSDSTDHLSQPAAQLANKGKARRSVRLSLHMLQTAGVRAGCSIVHCNWQLAIAQC